MMRLREYEEDAFERDQKARDAMGDAVAEHRARHGKLWNMCYKISTGVTERFIMNTEALMQV